MRRLIPLVAAVTLTVTSAACGNTARGNTESGPIKVGQIASLTGFLSTLGSENRKATELAVEQINAKGGLLGRKIELIVKDDKSEPDQSVLAFNDLKGSGVAAVIGSVASNSAVATIPLVDREKIPYLSLTPGDEQVNPIHPYVFVVPPTSYAYADRLLQYLKAVNLTKIAVAYDSKSSFSVAGFQGTKAKAAQYGITLVAVDEFQTSTTEFSSVFTHAKTAGAQTILAWVTGPPGVAMTKGFAASGLKMPLTMTGSQASKLFIDPVGPAGEGVVVASSLSAVGAYLPAGPQKEATDELTTAYQAKYGYTPPTFAGDGYNSVKLLAAAVTKAQSTDHAKIQAALEGLTLRTASGVFAYSPTNHSGLESKFISVNTIKGGALVPTEWAKTQFATISGL